MMKSRYSLYSLYFINGLLCLLCLVIFKPIVFEALGDAPAYIDLAKQIFNLHGAPPHDLSHRSPLYSLLIGILIMVFGESSFVFPVIFLQYLMILFTSGIIYKIIILITGNKKFAFIAGTLSTLNLSTIYFGYIIATETLSLYLFTFTVYRFIKYLKEQNSTDLLLASISTGLLILDRFNTMGLPLVMFSILLFHIILCYKNSQLKRNLKDIVIFIAPIIIILNAWALFNYLKNNFYGLIPVQHVGQRWAIPATINSANKVPAEYSIILEIFLKNIQIQKQKKINDICRKASLLNNPIVSKVNNFFSPEINGYYLYKASEKELLNVYNLPENSEGINQLGHKLKPFYSIIESQNSSQLFKLKLYSFFYSFKSLSPLLPGDSNLNLNKLPVGVLKLYKLIMIFMMVVVFLLSVFHLIWMFVKKNSHNNFVWIGIYGLIWYFPLVNFVANVLSDANRFKYPIESIVITVFIIYCVAAIKFVINKFNLLPTKNYTNNKS